MRTYILKRLFQLIPTIFTISVLVFAAMRLLPGDPLLGLIGDAYDEDNARVLRLEYGLDRPIVVQYVIWLGHLIHGDWGSSILNGSRSKGLCAVSLPSPLADPSGSCAVIAPWSL